MKIQPVLTEKSLEAASSGKYTFYVPKGMTKPKIALSINEIFDVHVTKVRTITVPGENKRTVYGRKKVTQPRKKAIVTLSEKEKIDIFETKD